MESLGKSGRARDGHWCDSHSEIRIDDALFERGIPRKRVPFYPGFIGWWRWYRADWQILCCSKVVLVEYWGLVDHPERGPAYRKRKAEKEAMLAGRKRITPISIYPDDLRNKNELEKILDRITELLDRYPPNELLGALKSLKRDCECLSKGVKVRGRPIGSKSYLAYTWKPDLSVEGLGKRTALKSIKGYLEEVHKEMLEKRMDEIKTKVCWKSKVIESRIKEVNEKVNELEIKIYLAEDPGLRWSSPISWFKKLFWLLGLSYVPWDGN